MEYCELTQRVSSFCEKNGLFHQGLFRDSYTSDDKNIGVISVSWKRHLDNTNLLYSENDSDRNVIRRFRFPIVTGSMAEIEKFREMAEEKEAEAFTKKSTAFEGYIQPSPEFLALTPVEQVEYALHEAFHITPKTFFGGTQKLLSPEYEEAAAMVVGHLGCIQFFDEFDLKQKAIAHWDKHFDLARKVKKGFTELEEILQLYRIAENGRLIPREKILEERDAFLEKARIELCNELGLPVNNAFFVYWNHFYGKVEATHNKLKGETKLLDIVKTLTTFNHWYF